MSFVAKIGFTVIVAKPQITKRPKASLFEKDIALYHLIYQQLEVILLKI
jgi:hypothetical protein